MTVLLAALLVGLDQLSKAWVVGSMPLGASEPLGLGFSITHSRNTGAAFGLLRDLSVPLGPLVIDGTFLLGLLSAAVSLALTIYLLANRGKLGALTGTALALVLAGAAGNMIDRFRLGYVVDFIHFRVGWFDFPVFNVADTCVVVGAGLLIVSTLVADGARRPGEEQAPKRRPAPREHALEEMPDLPPLGGRERAEHE